MTTTESNFATHHFGEIPLQNVIPSKTNPRKHFDEVTLNELAESIKALGLAQPILVRPLPTTEQQIDCVEIVCGERRYRASKLAGKTHIMAVCKDMTDDEVLKLQLIENLQRQDVHPIEEAEGYERLMNDLKISAVQIAKEVGKSKEYIYGRLKLCALTPANRELFYAGKMTASTALLVARIPVTALQNKAGADITKEVYGAEGMSYRQAQNHISNNYTLGLADARFNIKDAKLVDTAGACTSCPKRTGAQPEIYPDLKADVCTDPDCFQSKNMAHADKSAQAATKSGLPLLEGEAALREVTAQGLVQTTMRLFSFERFIRDQGKSHLQVAGLLTAKQLPKAKAYMRDDDGDVAYLYKRSELQTALEKAGFCETIEQQEERQRQRQAAQAKSLTDEEKEEIAKVEANERTAEIESEYRLALYKATRSKFIEQGNLATPLRETIAVLMDDWEMHSATAALYDFNPNVPDELDAFLQSADVGQLTTFLLDIACGIKLPVTSYDVKEWKAPNDDAYGVDLHRMAGECGIDVAAIRAQVASDTSQEPKAKAKKAASKKANNKPVIDPSKAWPFPTAAQMAEREAA